MHQRKLLVLAALVAVPGAAWSQPYARLLVGNAEADFPLGAPYNGVIDDSSIMYGIDVGMGFGRKWAFEFGANGYRRFDGLATPCPSGAVCPPVTQAVSGNDQTVYEIAAVRRFSIGRLQLYGKAGYYRAHIETNIGLPDADFETDGAALGAGATWFLRAPWSVSLEATRFDDNVSQLSVAFGWGLRSLFGINGGSPDTTVEPD
jgi:hypothetical protein